MEHFLDLYKSYRGNNPRLIVYATELSYSKELTGNLLDLYDDMLEVLHEELEQQERDSDRDHLLCDNELI